MRVPDYYCSKCGAEVQVTSDGSIRSCSHSGATIIAERTSNLFGDGDAAEKTLLDRASAALEKIISAFRGVNGAS